MFQRVQIDDYSAIATATAESALRCDAAGLGCHSDCTSASDSVLPAGWWLMPMLALSVFAWVKLALWIF